MNALTALAHNGRLMRRAEDIINGFLDSETENHKVYCYLVNPDGTRIAIQKDLNWNIMSMRYAPIRRNRRSAFEQIQKM